MNKLITAFLALFLVTGLSSCLKEEYDAPPTGGKDPDITVNFFIDALKDRYTGTTPYYINEDLVISAIVTADDKSGNFYKQIIIQDTTGAIALLLEGSNIFNDYPIGRRIFIKLRGLYLTQYKGVFQIAGSILPDGSTNGIPTALYDKFILKGSYFHVVEPKVLTISQLNQLNPANQNLLIKLEGVEFETADAGQTFADGYGKSSLSRTVKNCSGGSIETYNSGYALWANSLTPTGRGSLIAINSQYNTTAQLLLRDPAGDLHMDSVRCGGGPIGGGNGIMRIRNLYGGSDVTIPNGETVKGIVISDNSGGNFDPKNLAIQDSTGGIVIRFSNNHSFAVGDEVTVNLSGLTLTSYNGLYEVTFVPNANATKTGTGTITPRVATTAEVQANGDLWESTLITIENANIGGSGTTYNGTKTLTDITGTLNHYTRSGATFSGSSLPVGSNSFTGVLGDFNGLQLSIRTLADVQ
ncbi:MAG TPA: DUF5689 domain-containing protein [Chitinophagales bacterium]|nr:DUF5689 domain-containing protein [Chitinophagales bacterium]